MAPSSTGYCIACGARVGYDVEVCNACGSTLSDDGELPEVGTVLRDRYELRSLIGRGGMGGIFEAWDRELERAVAVKLLPRSLSRSRDTVRRFLTEARRVSALDHPNVIPIHDAGRDGDHLFFVMKLLRGHALEESVLSGALPVREALRIFAQILEGLDHIHGQKLVHRDIKPANVFVEDTGRVVILDFGILRDAEGGSRMTTAGVAVGTPDFMAPEVMRGDPADARSDIFSASVVLYEMLSARSPFAPTKSGGLPAQLLGPAAPIRTVASNVPVSVEELLKKGLAPEPPDRFASAREMLAAVRVIEAGILARQQDLASSATVAISTSRPGTPPPPGAARNRRASLAVGGLVLFAVGLAVFATFGTSSDATNEPESVRADSERPAPVAARAPATAAATVPATAPTPAPAPVPAPAPATDLPAVSTTTRPRVVRRAPSTSAPAAPATVRPQVRAAVSSASPERTPASAARARGEAYERVGNYNAAIGAYRRCLQLNPSSGDKAFVERRLAALGAP